MSSFSTKEAAAISRVSRLWEQRLCRVFPILNLTDSTVMKTLTHHHHLLHNETSKFVARVNKVVQLHNGPHLHDFILTFELDNTSRSDITKWLLFALQKGVRRLELDFSRATPLFVGDADDNRYTLSLDSNCMPPNLVHTITFLRLCRINIGSQDVECLMRSCMLLEALSIDDSKVLTTIKLVGFPLSLKQLEISNCWKLKEIDISAPKLLSFIYRGDHIRLRVGNAFALAHVSVSVVGNEDETLRGWFRLIEASPVLQILTLNVYPLFYCSCYEPIEEIIVERVKQPFTCLKTLKIVGFEGNYVDTVLAKYVIVNAMALDEVIVYVGTCVKTEKKGNLYARVKELVKFSPSLAKFTFEEPMKTSMF
ncbi:hypothetical protein KSS87_007483 [Heliosperma pusillum]|nr:hypothetical protein KSS87_007483 [Heliosperma pusillum]